MKERPLADPIAMILRFTGDPDALSARFEKARRLWIDAQSPDDPRPAFYAACKTDEGLVIVNVWETDAAHKAFARGIRPHLRAAGMGKPDHHEHLPIEKLGWD